jgi:hypothetical protein
MKISVWLAGGLLLSASLAGCFPLIVEDDTGDDTLDTDGCDLDPNLVADSFSFTDYDSGGTVLDFQDITLCNYSDATADPGSEYAVLLSQGADLTGDAYVVFESPALVGIAPWDCVSYAQSVPVGAGVPDGYYYVFVYADYLDAVFECDEYDNWARSDDAIYVTAPAASSLR